MHFGLRLPGTISSFGSVHSISVSNWAPLKRGIAMARTRKNERATHYSKVEAFDARETLARPSQIHEIDLQDISFYAFWRMFDVHGKRLSKNMHEILKYMQK